MLAFINSHSSLNSNKKSFFKRFILPIIALVLGIAFMFPIYILILSSLKTKQGLMTNLLGFPDSQTFSPNNYPDAFDKLKYFQSFFNSLYISVFSVALILLISTMAAWVLVRYKNKASKFIFGVFALSMLVPFQCVMLPLMMVAKSMNLLNPAGLIFMYMGFGVSMTVLMIHGFIKNIPEELEEAAVMDGCNVFQLFFLVVVPLLRVILITAAVLNLMWIWNDFLLPSIVINKAGWQTLPLMTYSFFGTYSTRWDLASAALVMCMAPIVVFYLFSQKYIVSGMTDGAIK